jgi:arabinofuranosyltransferase
MSLPARDKRLAIFVLPVIVLFFYINAALHFNYTPDDTYIYMQFARNLAHGGGFSFNFGEPTYGVTGPLWMMIIAFAGMFKIDPYLAAKALDLVAASAALTLFFYLSFEIIRDIYISLFATLAFSVNAWFLRWAGTGMETSFAMLLVLTIVWFSIRNEYFLAIFFSALFTLVRPEAWVLVPLILIDVYINSFNKTRGLKMIGGLFVIFIALVLPWLLYAQMTFGTVFPNTMFAKSNPGFDLADIGNTFIDFAKTLAVSDGVAAIILLFSLGFLGLRSKKGDDRDAQDANEGFYMFRQSLVPLGWVVLISILYCVKGVNIVSRYLLVLSPFIMIFSYLFFYRVFERSRWRRYTYIGAIVLSACIMLQNQVAYNVIVKPGIQAFEQSMEDCLIPMGKWFNRNTQPGAVVFVGDVGAVGYYSERTICDAAGLISPSILAYFRKGYTVEQMYKEKLYLQNHADYVVHRSYQPEALKSDTSLIPVFTKVMYQMGLSSSKPTYYTVYKVK